MKNDQAHHDELIAHLLGFMDMPEKFPDLLRPYLSPGISYDRDTIIYTPEQIADLAFWPVAGYIRYYERVKPEGDREYFVQKTVDISLPGKISLSANSFMNQVPVGYFLVIQKGSTMISFSHESFLNLSSIMPEIKDLALKIIGSGERDWYQKLEMCKVKCAEGYRKFLSHFDPVVMDFIGQQHIASYLGMASEELSRIRKSGKN